VPSIRATLREGIRIAIVICNYREAAFRFPMKKTIRSIAIATGLALICASPAFAKEKEEEESLKASDVPAAVQTAAESEAKGGKIVRWEKEGKHYEAVIEKNGKESGVEFDASGKVLSKHDESKEKGEKHEKH
jgi:plastocyanin